MATIVEKPYLILIILYLGIFFNALCARCLNSAQRVRFFGDFTKSTSLNLLIFANALSSNFPYQLPQLVERRITKQTKLLFR